MNKYFDVFFQPEADKMRVSLTPTDGNPARLADDVELLTEYHRRLAQDEGFRVTVNSYEDFLLGRQDLRELLERTPF